MSTSNEDLRVRIEQIDGKVNNVQEMVKDLKVTTLGIAGLERSVGEMRGDLKNVIEGITRTTARVDEAQRVMNEHRLWANAEKEKMVDRIEKQEQWRSWLMGGLGVLAFVSSAVMGLALWALNKTYENDKINDLQQQRLLVLERQVQIVNPINDKK